MNLTFLCGRFQNNLLRACDFFHFCLYHRRLRSLCIDEDRLNGNILSHIPPFVFHTPSDKLIAFVCGILLRQCYAAAVGYSLGTIDTSVMIEEGSFDHDVVIECLDHHVSVNQAPFRTAPAAEDLALRRTILWEGQGLTILKLFHTDDHAVGPVYKDNNTIFRFSDSGDNSVACDAGETAVPRHPVALRLDKLGRHGVLAEGNSLRTQHFSGNIFKDHKVGWLRSLNNFRVINQPVSGSNAEGDDVVASLGADRLPWNKAEFVAVFAAKCELPDILHLILGRIGIPILVDHDNSELTGIILIQFVQLAGDGVFLTTQILFAKVGLRRSVLAGLQSTVAINRAAPYVPGTASGYRAVAPIGPFAPASIGVVCGRSAGTVAVLGRRPHVVIGPSALCTLGQPIGDGIARRTGPGNLLLRGEIQAVRTVFSIAVGG